MFYRKFGKRALDFALALAALVVLLPLILLVALLVRVRMGAPLLFRQRRAGLRGRPFTIYKFRTMLLDPALPDADRLTPLGRVLRAASLDELPQLLNILKGEMSFIGPRPLPVEYLPRYSPAQRRRHAVRPGLSGWAQVNGRNSLSWDEKFNRDLWYVEHQSLRLDLRIGVLTLRQLFAPSGISHAGHATMPEFMGSGNW